MIDHVDDTTAHGATCGLPQTYPTVSIGRVRVARLLLALLARDAGPSGVGVVGVVVSAALPWLLAVGRSDARRRTSKMSSRRCLLRYLRCHCCRVPR